MLRGDFFNYSKKIYLGVLLLVLCVFCCDHSFEIHLSYYMHVLDCVCNLQGLVGGTRRLMVQCTTDMYPIAQHKR